jgi:hypothetical protein
MKLNPPASFSDLDEARAVARRLHQRAAGQDVSPAPGDTPAGEASAPDAPAPSTAPAPPGIPPAAPPLKLSTVPPEPAPPPPPPVDPYPEPGEDEEGGEPGLAPFPEAAQQESLESSAAEPEAGPPRLGSYEEDDEDEEMDPAEISGSNPFQPGPFEISVPGLDEDEEETSTEDELPSPEGGDEPAREWEASEEKTAPGRPPSPDFEMGRDEAAPPEDALAPEPTPPPHLWELEPDSEGPVTDDDALGVLTEATDEPTLEELEVPADSVSPADLVNGWGDESPAGEPGGAELEPEIAPDDLSTPPSWDDLADACLVGARAHGIMIVDATGQIVTARGQWPEPGPEAIGRRLVAMMERALADAPTRSVSAPLAGEHLTAWRVRVAEGYMTVVFMAESTLDNDARAAVDDEIHRTLGQ